MILYIMKKGYGVNLVFQKGKACIFPILGIKLWRQRSQRGMAATKKSLLGCLKINESTRKPIKLLSRGNIKAGVSVDRRVLPRAA
jgi:hypothetical protein